MEYAEHIVQLIEEILPTSLTKDVLFELCQNNQGELVLKFFTSADVIFRQRIHYCLSIIFQKHYQTLITGTVGGRDELILGTISVKELYEYLTLSKSRLCTLLNSELNKLFGLNLEDEKKKVLANSRIKCFNLLRIAYQSPILPPHFLQLKRDLKTKFKWINEDLNSLTLMQLIYETDALYTNLANHIQYAVEEHKEEIKSNFLTANAAYKEYLAITTELDRKKLRQLALTVLELAPESEIPKWENIISKLQKSSNKIKFHSAWYKFFNNPEDSLVEYYSRVVLDGRPSTCNESPKNT